MSGAVHIFTSPSQPATRWVDRVLNKTFVHRNPRHRLIPTFCCGKRRPAKNLIVKAYYDGVWFYCRPETGCRIPRKRVKAARILAREFKGGLSMVGLARKYGMTSRQVQVQIRKVFNHA